MHWIDKLERKYGKYAIRGLMKYIVILTGVVFFLGLIDPTGAFINKLDLNLHSVAKGEVWRLITYIFIPPSFHPIWALLALYFYYMMGTNLESSWGSFRFNLYYFIGVIATIVTVFITGGSATATYLNLSLFLAFAYMYPDHEMLIYYIIPVKIKYIGWLTWGYILITILTKPLYDKVTAIASVLNFLVFFGPGILRGTNTRRQSYNRRQDFKRKKQAAAVGLVQRCEVCGITHQEDPKMEFRYCSKCEGRHCYCMNHIKDHEHVITKPEDKVIEFPGKKEE